MASSKRIQGVLWNFLGTYTSRYSDYAGYWLFGFLPIASQVVQIDLLRPLTVAVDPLEHASRLAVERFGAQLRKAGLSPSQIREAWLAIEPLSEAAGLVNGNTCAGRDLRLTATAITGSERTYMAQRVVFVAPHNPRIEIRSGRALDQT